MGAKWAEIVDPQVPAREFARSVLSERMEIVETLLPLAAHHHTEDVEHVHQLRVGCRRAAAALRAFAPLMNHKPKVLKDWLGAIRAAAGPARDIDVLLMRFVDENADAVTDYAVGRLKKERRAAQKRLIKMAKRASSGALDEIVAQTLELLATKKRKRLQPLDQFGRQAVRLSYLPFSRLAHLENPTAAELHQLRIAGKRLRYSLEIFHGLCPELHQEVYPLMEELQTRLGEINDHATAQGLYQSWLGEIPAEELAADLAGRVIQEHRSVTRLSAQFLRWWNTKRVAKVDRFFAKFCG